ncbi:N-acetylgalactosaminyltransferase 7-like [Sinocyclocheilus grahami]|uniref:N-acetylgalactosaminyltransferase 7-like n=1 Tax=Sinocyclocheilus grahami TaxID=75366 RepID=UPI0007AC6815|nr:PREDICTED: N-acetylgalactosaminyltransferase 7-like [Sinocyclocheilus grahami]
MRLKVGFILRSLLVIGTFLGLVLLWSSLTPNGVDDNPFAGVLAGRDADKLLQPNLPNNDMADQFKPVVPWPHVEGVEVDLESIRQKNVDKPNPAFKAQNQQNVIQKQYITFKPHTNMFSEPVLKKGVLGNFEPKEPEPQGVQGGPGEGSKAFVLGPEYKDSVQASIKEFGFNMVASDMISLDRTVGDLRHEECKYWHYDENLLTSSVIIVFHNEGWSTLMRTVHSVIKRTPRKYLAEIVMIDDFSNKGSVKIVFISSSNTLHSMCNYVRVVEVWWDEYKDYFYASRPETLTLAYGDTSSLKKFREEHRCKSFKWFMEEIAYDIPLHYPLPPKNVEWGEIRGFETSYCIDSMGHTNGGNVEIGPCHRMGGNQLFRINEANQLMQYDQCLTKGGDGTAVIITHCNLNEHTEWRYFKDLHRFTHIPTGKCLDRSDVLHKVYIADCDNSKSSQKWEMNNIVAV